MRHGEFRAIPAAFAEQREVVEMHALGAALAVMQAMDGEQAHQGAAPGPAAPASTMSTKMQFIAARLSAPRNRATLPTSYRARARILVNFRL